jgi:hypothetical protein
MSSSTQASPISADNFTAIFDAALSEYKNRTGQDLQSHPFAVSLDDNNTPDAILEVFRREAQAFDKFHRRNDKLMAYLTPVVNVLFTFSATLGEGIGLVRPHSFHITIPQHMFRRCSRPRRQSSLPLVFFSG